jgi:hypothetical protein
MGWAFIAVGLVDIALGLLFWLRPSIARGNISSPGRRLVTPLLVVSGLFALGVGLLIAFF